MGSVATASVVIGALGLAHSVMSTKKQAGAQKKSRKAQEASLRKQEQMASVKAARNVKTQQKARDGEEN